MIALFKGEDAIARKQALDQAVRSWLGPRADDPYSKETIHVEDTSQEISPLDRFFRASGGTSLFSEQKAVILQGVDKLKAAQLDELTSLFSQENSSTGFFFEADKLNGNLRFSKTIKKLGKVHNFDRPKPWEMGKWLQGRAPHHGFRIDASAADFFIELTGPDQTKLDNELAKLRNYDLNATQITHSMLNTVVVSINQGNQFDFTKFFAQRNVPQALRSLHQIFKSGKKDFDHCIPLTALLFQHFQTLLITRELSEEGQMSDQIAKELNKHPFIFKKEDYVGQSRLHSIEKLQTILIRLSEIDAQLKNGGITSALQYEIELLQIL